LTDPCSLTASELAAAYSTGLLSPVDAVDACLARIARLDPIYGAFTAVHETEARRAAEAAHKARRAGHVQSPLAGVPIALKALVEVTGQLAAAGSHEYRDRVATRTATVAGKLMAAGAIILGRTHTVEFALGAWGTNAHLGTPRNPWGGAVHHAPGGSSSGSGVAVAARMTPLAIGTDTGGSVRIPAAFNGITGLKTTRGRISTYGITPLARSLDTVGPLARTVEDAALLHNLLHGPDPLDPATCGIAAEDVMAGLHRGVAGLRLARLEEQALEGLDAEVLAAYEAALVTLAGLGAAIVTVDLPHRLGDYAQLSGVMLAEAYAEHGQLAEDPATRLDPAVRGRLLSGRIAAAEYLRLLWRREAMAEEFLARLDGFDALLTPTTPLASVPLDQLDEAHAPSLLTRFVNLLGLCGLALPCGFTAGGMPLSLQIVGRPFAEAMVLRIGQGFQAAGDWHRRLPPDLLQDLP
jgi:aspartyl-tRNA(Asn)/glutamyl-tRNA(Gln) amidotransferase subunit A